MPSRLSPSQRTQEARQARQMAAQTLGGNAGRFISASRRTSPVPSNASPDVSQVILLSFSYTGTLAVTTGTHRQYLEHPGSIVSVRSSVGGAPAGASVIVDLNLSGTTVFTTTSNRPTIAIAGHTDLADAIDVANFAAGDYFTVDIDQVGSTTAGSDLTVTVEVQL